MNGAPSPDRMREEVAELLGIAAGEIAEEADLTDLGMDSVRMMTLADRWSTAEVRIDFSELVEDPRLSGWRALLAARFGEGSGAS